MVVTATQTKFPASAADGILSGDDNLHFEYRSKSDSLVFTENTKRAKESEIMVKNKAHSRHSFLEREPLSNSHLRRAAATSGPFQCQETNDTKEQSSN